MPRLGDNISPFKYQNQTPQALSRMELMIELYKALLACGMTPVYAYNRKLRHVPLETIVPGVDLLPTNMLGSSSAPNFEFVSVFDYPDSYTFEVDGQTLRPCLVMATGWDTGSTMTDQGHTFGMHHMARLDVADPNTDIFDKNGNIGLALKGLLQTNGSSSNMYMGSHDDIALSWFFWDAPGLFTSTQYWGNSSRVWRLTPDDDLNEGTTYGHDQLLPVGNIQVILSSGGLLIQVGSGAKKTQINNYINFLAVFGGERFPGRGIPEAEDLDRLHTNSSYELTLNDGSETSDTFYSNSTANRRAPNGILIGGQATDQATGLVLAQADSIKCRTMNFDNADVVFDNAKYHMATYNSPRAIDGTGYHILSPWIYVLEEQTTTNDLYAPGSAASTTSWRWRDVFYAPGLVFGDTIAPAGEYVDINTNKTFHMFYTQRFGEMLGIDVTGATQLTPASLPGLMPTHTLIDETVYTMVSGSVQIDSGVVTVIEGTPDAQWTIGDGGLDELKTTVWTTSDERAQTLKFDTVADPDDYAYEVLWDCTNYGDASTGPGNGTIHPRMNNSVFLEYLSGESGGENSGASYFPTAFGGVPNAGADTPPAVTVSSWVPRKIDTKKVEVAFTTEYHHGPATKTVVISNIRLRRWRLN